MMANKLKSLLAERKLTIKQIIKDTGLSRNTLSNIINNPLSNISLDTLNTLCIYLKITVDDFYSFVPFNFEYNIDIDHDHLLNEEDVKLGYPGYEYSCSAFIKVIKGSDQLANIEFDGTIEEYDGNFYGNENEISYSVALNYSNEQEKNKFKPFNEQLSLTLRGVIKQQLMNGFNKAINPNNEYKLKDQQLNINLS